MSCPNCTTTVEGVHQMDCPFYKDGQWGDDSKRVYPPGFMSIETAMGIVYELAEQNALESDLDKLDEMYDEMTRQHLALDVVHDFAVNQLGDD